MPRPILPPVSAEVTVTLRVPRAHWPALSRAVHAQTVGEPYRDTSHFYALAKFNPVAAAEHMLRPPRPREQAADWLTNNLTHIAHLRPHITGWNFQRR